MKNMLVYVAGGWFTPDQLKSVEEIEEALDIANIKYYSPRRDALWKPGMDHKLIVSENMDNIDECTFILASTEGKDLGTLFECGYAFARGVPVVYYFKHEGKFNIMLAATGQAVITNLYELTGYLSIVRDTGRLPKIHYIGNME